MQTILTLIIGLFIGASAGMFGIGGALLATPLLKVVLGLPALLSIATPLPAAIPAAVSGSFAYARKGLVRYDVVWKVLVIALPMSIAGAFLTKVVGGPLLMVLTGVLLVYSGITFLQKGFGKKKPASSGGATGNPGKAESQEGSSEGPLLYYAGALAGFLSGFLAIGGGIVLVPVFVRLLGLPTKVALASSLLCVAGLAVPGVIVHAWLGNIDWPVALLLCVSVVPMSFVGARIASSLSNRTIERIYGIAMTGFALYFVVVNLVPSATR